MYCYQYITCISDNTKLWNRQIMYVIKIKLKKCSLLQLVSGLKGSCQMMILNDSFWRLHPLLSGWMRLLVFRRLVTHFKMLTRDSTFLSLFSHKIDDTSISFPLEIFVDDTLNDCDFFNVNDFVFYTLRFYVKKSFNCTTSLINVSDKLFTCALWNNINDCNNIPTLL